MGPSTPEGNQGLRLALEDVASMAMEATRLVSERLREIAIPLLPGSDSEADATKAEASPLDPAEASPLEPSPPPSTASSTAAESSAAGLPGEPVKTPIGPAAEPAVPVVIERPPLNVDDCTVSGDGLHAAVVGQTTQFVISSGRSEGGDKFFVTVSGSTAFRVRVFDEGDGRYICEYRPPASGKYRECPPIS